MRVRGLHAVGWWAAFAGMFASTATCPCCGGAMGACPTSLAGAGLVGVGGAWLMGRLRQRYGKTGVMRAEAEERSPVFSIGGEHSRWCAERGVAGERILAFTMISEEATR